MNSENTVVIELATCACNDPTAVFERGTRGSSALTPHEAVLNWSKDVEDGASRAPFNNTSCALDVDKPLGILCHTCAKTFHMQHIPTRYQHDVFRKIRVFANQLRSMVAAAVTRSRSQQRLPPSRARSGSVAVSPVPARSSISRVDMRNLVEPQTTAPEKS